jgi:hypothetical protein
MAWVSSSKIRSLRAQVAALERAALYPDPLGDLTQRVRDAYWEKLLARVDTAAPGLSEAERHKRAKMLA